MKIVFTDTYKSITGKKYEYFPESWSIRDSRYQGKVEIIDSSNKVAFLWNKQNIEKVVYDE